MKLRFIALLAFSLSSFSSHADYLNESNITVTLGEGMAAEPFRNRGAAESLLSIVDAESAIDFEVHTQSSHVWFTGEELRVVLTFDDIYDLSQMHFWNFTSEAYDVDRIELTSLDNRDSSIVSAIINDPEFGKSGPVRFAIFAQDFPLPVQGVKSVLASF